MGDALDIIVQRMNKFRKFFSDKSDIYLKKAIYKSEEYADKGIKQIENEKLRWRLKKTYIELGKYIYSSNAKKNIFDYSDDEKFILLSDKIKRIKNLINPLNKK